MFFNTDNNHTNIDTDFDNKKKFNFIYLIIGIVGLIIVIGLIFFLPKIFHKEYYLVLNGDTDIIVKQNSIYEEAGFKATDNKGNDLSNQVEITGQVNTAVAGEYIITYTLEDKVITRTVLVVAEENQVTYLILSGSATIFLKVGEQYTEPGYTVIDNLEDNLTNKVTVSGDVNTNASGTYKLIYTVTNKSGETVREERTIIVMDSDINLNYMPTSATNGEVTINVSISDNYFDYLLLPDNTKITARSTTYKVNKNGTYKFTIYSKDGSYKYQEVIINNIDKEAPNITSCTGTINENITTYVVKTDDNDITKFVYNNQYTATSKTYTINKNVPNATLVVYDRAGNTSQVTCKTTIINNYEPQIKPIGNENIIKQAETDTLKFWIEKKTRSGRPEYYVAHIWAKDPYNQLKSGVPNNFGNELLKPANILTQKINKLGLQNKLIISINGSGFCLQGVYDVDLYNMNHAFNKTSVSPIVISEGNVLRDLTKGQVKKSYATYGLKKNGYLEYYEYGSNIQENIATAQKVISDGVKDTWAFTPVLVYEGKVKSQANSRNIRNGICQIDKNNFILITDVYKSDRQGFTFGELAQYMSSLGCKYGFNLDGGGSVAMMYKDKNSTSPTIITGNNRNIADILYFHE